jgi:asparagine synthase (glutamine-hydrolysing)
MCRIAGIITDNLNTGELHKYVNQMCDALQHGGPDDSGIYHDITLGVCLGHRRLSIIDLTTTGHQPMADVSQRIWITFNGEIFNYKELKQQLLALDATFHSNSDTEVIIQAYKHWGVISFSKLKGIFAFALHDADNKLTYLVRDTSGVKPIYYHVNGKNICFASEIRALRVSGLAGETDKSWPIRFLAFGHIPEPYTVLKDVLCLPKGSYLCWDHQEGNYYIKSYALSPKQGGMITNHADAKQSVKEAFNAAVSRQMIADAPIGVFLSGGIDSSIITLLAAAHNNEQLKTVSIYFEESAYNERAYQNLILQKTGCENFSHLVTQDDFNVLFKDAVEAMDMPTTDGINSWFISKYAHEAGLKAVLSGLGADELFGGYPSFKRVKYVNYLKQLPSTILRALSKITNSGYKRIEYLAYDHPLGEYLFLRGMFVPSQIARILNISESEVTRTLFDQSSGIEDAVKDDELKAAWFEKNLYMQNQLLRDTDAMSMQHGLEVRVPFLDEDFLHTVERISPALKFTGAIPKQLLIDSFHDILPEGIWNRKKMGFSFPLQQWMADYGDLSNPNNYHGKETQHIIKNFKNNREHWSKAYALYQLQQHV